jgi:RNA polymerase sigma-70 factor (ECF subfamily)
MNDDDAIRAVLEGNREAFRVLVERYSPMARAFAGRLLGHTQDAEDVCQEAFVAAFRFLSRFDRSAGAFSTWLLTIVRHRSINHVERRRPPPTQAGCGEIAVETRSPLDAAAASEMERKIDGALAKLPIEQRSAFVLVEMSALSVAEAAAVEGVPVGTIKSRASRARLRLRQLLPEYQPREVDDDAP